MARGRGRPGGFKMSEEHKTKIANSQILKRLIEFAEGKDGIDMKPHQVTAALGLMKKVMPDMTHNENDNEHHGEVTFKTVYEGK